MAAFAYPFALFALGAVALPVLLYLLRRPRQVVRVGSLRPLELQRTPPALRWQPRWLLLALRCALLATLALLLADPVVTPAPLGKVRWLLRAPGVALSVADQAAWDTARREGWEPHELAADFAAIGPARPAEPSADYWSLLAELDARVVAGSRAMVFAPTTAGHFPGSRPTFSRLEVTWRAIDVPPPVTAAASGLNFAVFAPPEDRVVADRLRAALAAAGGREDAASATWVVQLGRQAPAEEILRRVAAGATLVTEPDASAEEHVTPRFFVVGGERVAVQRSVAVPPGAVRLRDDQGEPLVTELDRGRGRWWRLGFRLDPTWTDWTLRAAFPRWWLDQLLAHDPNQLTLATSQVLPAFVAADSVPSLPPAPRRVAGWLWLVAVALFVAERWFSWRQTRRVVA